MESGRVSENLFNISRMESGFRKKRVGTTWWWSRALETLSAKPEWYSLSEKKIKREGLWSLKKIKRGGLWSLKIKREGLWSLKKLKREGLWSLNRVEWKHCQRHNGPEGWTLLTKVTALGHIESCCTNIDQILSSESQPSINFEISTKHQHFNYTLTSKSWPNLASESRPKLNLITWTNHQQQ